MPTIDLFINVTAPPYNAAGDGFTDDTVALQNAINASVASPTNQQRVELPRGTYIISSSLTLPSGVWIEGNGSTIKRQSGTTVTYDLLMNNDPVNGNENITIKNLVIDGDRQADSLTAVTNSHRFAGLCFEDVRDSYLENVTVNNTVNGEIQPAGQKTTGGAYFHDCININCVRLNGFGNDRSAIFIYESTQVRIYGSITANNDGSGITSHTADECEYHDILSYDNGENVDGSAYSNVSINGLRSKGSNITTYRATGSGLNIGHEDNAADYTFVSRVHSYENILEGVSIGGSRGVCISHIFAEGNVRNNIRVFVGSTQSKISQLVAKASDGNGVLYDSGSGHIIESAQVFENQYAGIYVSQDSQVVIGLGVETYNNSQAGVGVAAGVIIDGAWDCKIHGLSAYDTQSTKTQHGVWIAGNGTSVRPNQVMFDWGIKNNVTNIKQTSIISLQKDNQVLHDGNEFFDISGTLPNGWTATSGTGYWLDRNGFVHLNGIFNGGTVATHCFVLPAGFRPETPQQFANSANNAHGNVVVDVTGNIYLYNTNVNQYVDGISFKAKIV